MPLLPYVTNPGQPSIRTWAYAEVGVNLQANGAKLDNEGDEIDTGNRNPEQQRNDDQLLAQLQAIRDSVPSCPGDGNIDFVIDQADLDEWRCYADRTGQSSVYDIDLDGLTNDADQALIQSSLGTICA